MMKLVAIVVVCVASISSAQAVEKSKLVLEESKIEFVGKKTDGAHKGGFKKFEAEAATDFEDATKGNLSIDIDTASLWSDDDKLTNHLKNPDFFDVRKHPKISFTFTKKVPGKEEGKSMISGHLTMLGKKIEIEIPCTVAVDEKKMKIDTKFVIDRTRWGMTYGEGKINKEVEIEARLVFLR